MNQDKKILYEVGKFCKFYRLTKLEKTLREVQGNEKLKTLSSFEHGGSSNFLHIMKYVDFMHENEAKMFFKRITEIVYDIKHCNDCE